MTEEEYEAKIEELQEAVGELTEERNDLKEERDDLRDQIAKRNSAFDDIERIAREYS